MARLIPSALVLAALLGACTLVDQRTFNPRAGLGPVVPPGPGPAPALITIDFERPDPAYTAQLRAVVEQAVSLKPLVAFDVVTVVPAIGTVAQQADAAGSIRADARDVARTIAEQGVDDDRIHLMARAEPGAAGRQVQVYVH